MYLADFIENYLDSNAGTKIELSCSAMDEKMETNILLLDDDEGIFASINRLIRPLNVSLLSTSSVDRAISFCEEKDVQVVIADSNRRDEDVNEFFRAVNEIIPLTRKLI